MSGRSNRRIKVQPTQVEEGTQKGRVSSEYGEKIYSPPHSDLSVEIDKEALERDIVTLSKHADVLIEKLPKNMMGTFERVAKNMTHVYERDSELYTYLIRDVVSKNFQTKEPKPRTVGAYFVGCSNNHSSHPNLTCSPSCVASLPHNNSGKCDELVLIYTPTKIIKALNSPHKPTSAQMYIEDPSKFNGFTTSDIKALQDYGITHVTVINGKLTTYRTEDLPVENQSSSNGGWIFLGILLFLIAAGGLGYVAYKGNMFNVMEV